LLGDETENEKTNREVAERSVHRRRGV